MVGWYGEWFDTLNPKPALDDLLCSVPRSSHFSTLWPGDALLLFMCALLRRIWCTFPLRIVQIAAYSAFFFSGQAFELANAGPTGLMVRSAKFEKSETMERVGMGRLMIDLASVVTTPIRTEKTQEVFESVVTASWQSSSGPRSAFTCSTESFSCSCSLLLRPA
ncbi:hypothetical protein AYO08_05910 [Pseudomonas putida]|nr:hypothetical protein AYO08_05910 [Pseudomonas putida]